MKARTAAVLASVVLFAFPALAQTGSKPLLPPVGNSARKASSGLAAVMPVAAAPKERGSRAPEPPESHDVPPPPPSPGAAEFSFHRGQTEIKVRCSDKEPVRACADAALMLMDKFGMMTAGARDAAPQPGEAAPVPPAQ